MVEYSSVMRSTGDHLVVVVEEASLEEHDHTVSKGCVVEPELDQRSDRST